MATILVVDDEIGIRELLSEILEDEGHEIVLAENAAAARKALPECKPALVLLDIWMPDTDGLTLLKEWVAVGALHCPVVMMSGHATIDTAVEATGLGAMDFLEKPVAMHRLLASVHKALARGALAAPNLPNKAAALVPTQENDAGMQALAVETEDSTTPSASIKDSQVMGLNPWQQALSSLDLDQHLRDVRDQFETIYFNHLLAKENWAITRVAEACGLERTHLYRKLKALGIEIARHGKHADAPTPPTDNSQ